MSALSNATIVISVLFVALSYEQTKENHKLEFYEETDQKREILQNNSYYIRIPVQCRLYVENNEVLSRSKLFNVLTQKQFENDRFPSQTSVIVLKCKYQSGLNFKFLLKNFCFKFHWNSSNCKCNQYLDRDFVHSSLNLSYEVVVNVLQSKIKFVLDSWNSEPVSKSEQNVWSKHQNYSIIHCIIHKKVLKQNIVFIKRNHSFTFNSTLIICKMKISEFSTKTEKSKTYLLKFDVLVNGFFENYTGFHNHLREIENQKQNLQLKLNLNVLKRNKMNNLSQTKKYEYYDVESSNNKQYVDIHSSKRKKRSAEIEMKHNISQRMDNVTQETSVIGKQKTTESDKNTMSEKKTTESDKNMMSEKKTTESDKNTMSEKKTTESDKNTMSEKKTTESDKNMMFTLRRTGLNETELSDFEKDFILKYTKSPQWAFGCVVFIILLILFAVQYSGLFKNCNRDYVVVDHKQVHYVSVNELVRKRAKILPSLKILLKSYEMRRHQYVDEEDILTAVISESNKSNEDIKENIDDLTLQNRKRKRNIFGAVKKVFSKKLRHKPPNKEMVPLMEDQEDSEDEIYDLDEYRKLEIDDVSTASGAIEMKVLSTGNSDTDQTVISLGNVQGNQQEMESHIERRRTNGSDNNSSNNNGSKFTYPVISQL